jgi:diguanylate cyclase (GGDEF)-like protein
VEVELTDDGTPCRVSGTLQDITERKQAELLEADRNSILQMIIQDEPLPNILNRLLQVIERQRPEAVGALALIQDDQIKVSAAPRLPQPLAQAMDGLPIGVEAGSCGLAAYLGQTVVTVDISTDPYWLKCRDAALASGIQAACSVPIFSGKGRVLGTIALYHRRPHQPSEEDLRLIEKLAQLAAVAIEQRHLSELLMHQAQHDALTGLLNRRAMSQYLSRSLSQTARYGLNGAILLIDLDRFKRINDSLGHQVGDLLLNQVADRLKGCTRKSDTLGRIGGDEFVLVMSAISSQRDAVKAAERILEHINKPFQVQGHQLHIGASIGISLYPHDGSDAAVIQRNADIAMYVAKNDGGNRFHFFNEEMNVAAIQRLEIENDLRKGIERGEFVLHYQPQYNLQTGRLIALEALIRWNHPEYGRIPPNKFIPVAEESRLIIPIGAWVIREACRQNAAWQAQGYPPVRVAVNVSAVQFTETDFAQTVANALKESGLAPEWLEIEITETVILKDKEVVHLNLAKLKEMGLITTIDDFGTGYSSITYLRQMPLDCLKIDRSFIREMVGDDASAQRTQTLVRAFVALAHNLNLNLVAEGIESIDQCGFLSEVGCAMGQGFLFSAPVPPDEIKTLLKEGKREPCPGIPEGSGRAKDNQEGVQGVR